jgi:hypothetical protein
VRDESRPRYGREIGREFARTMRPWKWQWRGRYVWWAQLVQLGGLAVVAAIVWHAAGGREAGGRAVWPAFWACLVVVAIAALAELEARVTERHLEHRRQLAEARDRRTVPDGYVIAYELGGQPGQLGTREGEAPFVIVAAVRADRWDLVDAIWRFSVVASPVGLVAHLPVGGLRGVSALGGFFAQLDAGEYADLVAVERALTAWGARDVTSTYRQPAGD